MSDPLDNRFAAFIKREERLVLYNALCAYSRSCALRDERALRMGNSPCKEYDIVKQLWSELAQEGMGPASSVI